MRRLNWMPSGRAMDRTIHRYGSMEQCAVDGMRMARRYVSRVSSSGCRGPDQSLTRRPTRAASSARSWRSGIQGRWNPQMYEPAVVCLMSESIAERQRRGCGMDDTASRRTSLGRMAAAVHAR